MKYKLINAKTNEETICDKVTIDGYDYYVSDELPRNEDYGFTKLNTITKIGYGFDYKLYRKAIATNNPNINILKVVDEVERLGREFLKEKGLKENSIAFTPFILGYNKSQETHPFSEKDMIEFSEWTKSNGKATKELLQLWKQQQPKTLYYE
jgi:hypothetical protein